MILDRLDDIGLVQLKTETKPKKPQNSSSIIRWFQKRGTNVLYVVSDKLFRKLLDWNFREFETHLYPMMFAFHVKSRETIKPNETNFLWKQW